MTFGRIACVLAVLAVVCVLTIFFFPHIDGPYSTVHGPVTALLSMRAAARLRLLIPAVVLVVRSWLASACLALVPLSLAAALLAECLLSSPSKGSLSVLRC
jgi:hypothetical protein